jgi:hypothetical protein
MFLHLREAFKANERFSDLFQLIDENDERLKHVQFSKKQDFIGFYEDIALLINSGILREEIAHYMFAYYAIKCWESEHFWDQLDRDSPYWALFKCFVEKMKTHASSISKDSTSVSRYKI